MTRRQIEITVLCAGLIAASFITLMSLAFPGLFGIGVALLTQWRAVFFALLFFGLLFTFVMSFSHRDNITEMTVGIWIAVFLAYTLTASILPAGHWIGLAMYSLLPIAVVRVIRFRARIPHAMLWTLYWLALMPVAAAFCSVAFRQPGAYISTVFSLGYTTVYLLVFTIAYIVKPRKKRETELAMGGALLGLGWLGATVECLMVKHLDVHFLYWGMISFLLCRMVYGIRQYLNHQREITELATREEEYRVAARNSGYFVMRYQIKTRCGYCQASTAEYFGLPETMNDMPESMIRTGKVVEQSVGSYLDFYRHMLIGEREGSGVFGFRDQQGAAVWLHADFTTMFDDDGNPNHSIISCYEVHGMREREVAYTKCRDAYAMVDTSINSWYELDLTANQAISQHGEWLSKAPDEAMSSYQALIEYLANTLIASEDREAFREMLSRERLLSCYEQDIRREMMECHRTCDGKKLWTGVQVQMIADPHSINVFTFLQLKDIEPDKQREELNKRRSQADELTGLLSRAAFTAQFTDCCAQANHEHQHALIMIDLDGFKAVNDTFGHRFGDNVLIDVANDLRAIMRADDLLCRLGGDEFIICMKNVVKENNILERRCREICHSLTKQFSDEVAMTCSLGVALYPDDGQSFDELYQHVDRAMYDAKQRGRNCYVFYRDIKTNKAAPETAPSETRSDKPVMERSAEEQPGTVEARHTVLVVDDQRMNRAILREIFKNEYNILEASNGRDALKILSGAQQSISAMILDLMMPEMSGFDVLREINDDPYYQSIPVVVVSAASEEENSLKAIELGAVDFVTKPIDEQLVRLRIHNAIFRRETENLRARNRELLVQRADEARHQNQLRYMADHDALTQLLNKNAFYRSARAMINEHPDIDYCLVSFDVQRFRAVNDIFGHEEGDRMLRYIAMHLQSIIGTNGTYSRVNTDNFAYCMPYSDEDYLKVIEKLMSAVKDYDLSFEVLLSFGIFLIDDRDLSLNQMHDRAEMAKRTIKDSYFKRWSLYDDTMRNVMLEEQEIVNHMEPALQNGEFVVYYQPKCRLDTGLIVGAEALVRWNHKLRGLLPPGMFIPLFEKNGFIMKLDVYMWEHVCMFLSQRLKEHPEERIHVSVNISRANLYNPNLCRTLEELCLRYKVPKELVHVEITESAYVENAHLLLGLTDELHKLGFIVEMDDFGSGYSSLNMLTEIPVDVLKLDMHFLYGTNFNQRGGSILRSTIAMARHLRMQVIAEGVETDEQAHFLASIGCGVAQGYYYAAPMPTEAFEDKLDAQPTIEDALVGDRDDIMARVNKLLCSAGVCERTPNSLKLLGANEYYLSMMRIDQDALDSVDLNLMNWLGADDRQLLNDALDKAREQGRISECVYLQRDLADKYHLLRAVVLFLGASDERDQFLITFTDASEDKGRRTGYENAWSM